MDGNRRWARQRGVPVAAGHAAGARVVRGLVEACAQRGIRYVTLFAFSTENWQRPAHEVQWLMRLFDRYLRSQIDAMSEAGVRLRVIGDRTRFSAVLQGLIERAEAVTAANERITLTVAANYGGRWDVLQAVRAWQRAHPMHGLEALDEGQLEPFLATAEAPPVDLLVRTGGEQRISNFLLWQAAYAELYFTQRYWPDFDAAALDEALAWYANRDRRYGGDSRLATAT